MGRKIPGKKHKGIKDPEKQRAERFNSIKNKINAPPTNADEQHFPKSLIRIMELKERVRNGEIPLRRKPIIKPNRNQGKRPEKPTPVFKQHKGETDKNFLYRVKKTCQEFLNEAAFEDKYGVDVIRNKKTGEVEEVVKREKDELEELVKKAKKELDNPKIKKKKKKKKEESNEPRLTKAQKRKKKLLEKKEKKSNGKVDEFKTYEDNVQFGEIVHAPPTLVAPKKANSLNCAPRPGQKDLLLKSVLVGKEVTTKNNVPKTSKSEAAMKKTVRKTIDRKGKRKDLPHALRRQLEKQQKEVIEAYKLIKSQKNK